jgi:hypothetical protein
VFDAVDFAAREGGPWPAVRRVRIAGFGQEITVFASEDDYLAASAARPEPRLAAKSFISIGLFAAEAGGPPEPSAPQAPSSNALLTGRIASHRRFTNEATGRDFDWFLVESLDATFDVVADPEIVKGRIVPGGIVEATCWLFGRFLD